MTRTLLIVAAASVVVAMAAPATPTVPSAGAEHTGAGIEFPHATHRAFFPECTTCHGGVAEGNPFPDPSFCETCHNGSMAPEISWTPPRGGSRANLKFTHAAHPPIGCETCHVDGETVGRPIVSVCLSCHGGESHFEQPASACATCHVHPPAPASHVSEWRQLHGREAAADPEWCATCHVRSDCLDCHRPGGASPGGGYHPADYLSSHPAAAYSRAINCVDCHNVGSFCQTCHQQAGLAAEQGLGIGYHDAKRNFVGGHGQAARQSLETCVACHTENYCVRCHATTNPHGPDFDAARQRAASPAVCAVCHG